ncbi:MAG: sodium-translocating pyrophosphatase [Deltaproteobacteria bacterium]|nr:sodium-translocating pyrophosphatase [Deltaproteobacteria bacterium]
MEWLMITIPLFGILALLFAYVRASWINKQDMGTDRMKEICGYVREGAMAFLASEYKILAVFVVCVAAILAFLNRGGAIEGTYTSPLIAVSFVVGAFCSALSGFFGMRVATAANARTTNAARTSLNGALKVAFSGGTVMGFSVVGLSLLGLGVLLYAYRNFGLLGDHSSNIESVVTVLSGFSLGASSIALFARVGGGIYTKAADVGADLVGKVEAGIPEDDPRNPATIADNVGDNVGDVAGMGADLFESYVGAIVGAMVLGATAIGFDGASFNAVILPLVIAGAGIVVSIIGTFFVKVTEGGNPQAALNKGTFGAAIVMLPVTYYVSVKLIPSSINIAGQDITGSGIFFATIFGLIAGVLVGVFSEYYTSKDKGPARKIAAESETGPATTIIAGMATGMSSTCLTTLCIAGAIITSYYFAGLYGIAIAALGMLSTTGIQLAVDAYGPIADNAGGLAEMAGLPKEVRERTDMLDAVGNTTAAIGKGFAIGSAALTALALFAAYRVQAGVGVLDLTQPDIMAGLFIGAMLPFLFSSMSMKAVGEAAKDMIVEVRRQFREIPGLLEGKAKAEYAKCVEISTKASLRKMVAPSLMAIIVPVAFGYLDKEALGGLLAGCTVTGVLLAIFQANAGGAWDNAKKYIEEGHHGGKGSDAHKAAVIGDTVGDPFKDTSGPSLNILIKLMSVVALVIAPLIK